MYGDEYVYEKMGYRHIAAKFRKISEEEREKDAVDISDISLETPTQEELDAYKQFRKENLELQMVKNDEFKKIFMLLLYSIPAVVSGYLGFIFLKDGQYESGIACMAYTIFYIGAVIYIAYYLRVKRTRVDKPLGVAYGYLVNSSVYTQTQTGKYRHNEVQYSFSDIWIEKDNKYLLQVSQPLYRFRYAGKEYCWSELMYTPVTVFVFRKKRIEVMPAYARGFGRI